jgi:hypothetical protein
MDFVGEMLGRPDLDEDSDPSTSIGDHEAISLAEDLGIITPTQGLRLKHSRELVTHFNNLSHEDAELEAMTQQETVMVLRTCIGSILGRPNFDVAIRFADFRRALRERTLKADAEQVIKVLSGPYFFVRTTLSVLLSMIRTERGAGKEHAVGNLQLMLPLLWEKLRKPEKWQIGQVYAEVNAKGDRSAAAGLKASLLKVQGFDFVPETLRSNTYTEAAARVLTAHFEYNNYANEVEPMKTLAQLGTAIPKPAFARCMEATLAVWLGNIWGHSWAAESWAAQILSSLRREQWEYYFNECLNRDRTVLDKLLWSGKPVNRWLKLVDAYELKGCSIQDPGVSKLIKASVDRNEAAVKTSSIRLREKVRE